MKNKRTRLLSVIAIITIFNGVLSVIYSFPSFALKTSLKQGGLTVSDQVTITRVQPNSTAEQAQLLKDDVIDAVNSQKISSTEQFIDLINSLVGQEITITYKRAGSSYSNRLIPRINPPLSEGKVGIEIINRGVEKKPVYEIIPRAIIRSYMVYEESPFFKSVYLAIPSEYTIINFDKTFHRLQNLVVGFITIVIGIGLWRLKKWAYFGFIGATIYSVLWFLFYLISSQPWTYINLAFLANISGIAIMFIFIAYSVIIAIQICFTFYVYKQKKLFHA